MKFLNLLIPRIMSVMVGISTVCCGKDFLIQTYSLKSMVLRDTGDPRLLLPLFRNFLLLMTAHTLNHCWHNITSATGTPDKSCYLITYLF